jgi:hypothetical protein
MSRMTDRADFIEADFLIEADFRHAAIVEKFCSEIDRP